MADTAGSRLYYGWVIAFTAFLILSVSNGMTLTGPTVFDELIIDELSAIGIVNELNQAHGITVDPQALRALAEDGRIRAGVPALRGLLAAEGVILEDAELRALVDRGVVTVGALKLRDLITLFTAGALGFFAGALADRVGVKPLMVAGMLLLAVAYGYYGQVQSLRDVYIVHFLFGVLLTLAGLIVNVILVSRWFVRKRGLAIGIALAGTSIGNAVLPPLNAWLLNFGDWREVFLWVAVLPLVMIPLIVLLVRNQPPKNASDAAGKAAEAATHYGMTLGEALRSRNFWMLAGLAMCTFYSILAMGTHTFLFMREEGYSVMVASSASSILFIGGLVGKLISGHLAETLGRQRVLLVGLALMFSGVLCIVLTSTIHSPQLLWIGLGLFGFGWGGIYTLIQLLCADLFGLKSLGKIVGAITVLDTFGGGLGPFVTGLLYDSSGSYFLPFVVISILLAVAILCGLLLRTDVVDKMRPPGGRDGESAEDVPERSARQIGAA
ncbi:MAG: MFS transporter [Gammaproteobacteria bacterium]|nr:MFS transporter [Gammaproteobacteria bacterium]